MDNSNTDRRYFLLVALAAFTVAASFRAAASPKPQNVQSPKGPVTIQGNIIEITARARYENARLHLRYDAGTGAMTLIKLSNENSKTLTFHANENEFWQEDTQRVMLEKKDPIGGFAIAAVVPPALLIYLRGFLERHREFPQSQNTVAEIKNLPELVSCAVHLSAVATTSPATPNPMRPEQIAAAEGKTPMTDETGNHYARWRRGEVPNPSPIEAAQTPPPLDNADMMNYLERFTPKRPTQKSCAILRLLN
jgi:hypothetical protein